MKYIKKVSLLSVFLLFLLTNVYAEETFNPYANIPPEAMGGVDINKMMQAQQEREQKNKKKSAERKAISQAIADEELAKAKAETAAGSFDDPYAIAEMRTRKRMAPIHEKWKQEDAAERAPMENQAQQMYQNYQQTGDHAEFGRQQRQLMQQMGIELPDNSKR